MRSAWWIVLAACGSSRPVPAPTVTKSVTNDLDVLFVIDNTGDADVQALLAQNFPVFVQALDARPGGRPNVHLGVVSSTVGTGSDVNFGANCPKVAPDGDGLLQNTPRISGCTAPTGRFVSYSKNANGAGTCNYAGPCDGSSTDETDLSNAFTCIAELGTNGCGFEAELESLKRALDGSRPENAGFVRDSSDLAILILTDEDDCSVKDPEIFALDNVGPGDFRCIAFGYTCDQPISTTMGGTYTNCKEHTGSYLQDTAYYHDFLATVKDRGQIAFAVIAGDPKTTLQVGSTTAPFNQPLALQPSCTGVNNSAADSGIRLNTLVTELPDHALFSSVCNSDYSPALENFASLIIDVMSPCLDASIDPTDADAKANGLQLACTAQQAGAAVPACMMLDATTPDPSSAIPCIWYEANATACSARTSRIAAHVQGGSGGDYQVTCPVHY